MNTNALSLSRRSFALAGIAAALIPFAPARADVAAAKTFIDGLAAEVLSILRTGNKLSRADREARFRKLFQTSVDMTTVGRFVLGRYYREMTPEQIATYNDLFEKFVVKTYAKRLGEYSGEAFVTTGANADSADQTIVNTEIRREGGMPPTKVDWRVRQKDGRYAIVDVVIEGVSMAVTQRSEFASVIQANGGQVSALLTRLQDQIKSLDT